MHCSDYNVLFHIASCFRIVTVVLFRKMEVAKLTPVNLYRLSKITDTTESTVNFVKDVGLIPKSVKCLTCSAVLYNLTM